MKIAIFGGSGKVGEALLPALMDRGHRIRAMRHRTPLPVEGVEVVEGSIADPAAVAETIGDAEVVLHMTKDGDSIEQVVEISVRGTVNILDAIRRAPRVGQYLLTSSDAATGIWSHPHPQPVNHQSPPASYPGYYSLGKVLEEVVAAEYHRNGPLPYTIARLSYVHQEDSVLRVFVANCDAKRIGAGPFSREYSAQQKQRLEGGDQFIVLPCEATGKPLARTLVQREDVISALAAMVGADQALRQTFHVSGPGFSYEQPCKYLAEKLGLSIERVRLSDAYSFEIDVNHTTELLQWSCRYDVIAMLDAALAWRWEQSC